MAVTRPDKFLTVSFEHAEDAWTQFTVKWREEIDDGTNVPWTRSRSASYLIADLPAQVRTDLLSAWDGMKAHRNSETPID